MTEKLEDAIEEVTKENNAEEFAALKSDFLQIIDRGVKSFQELALGRVLEHITLRLQGRYGIIVQTNESGRPVVERCGIELDNQENKRMQRMYMGMNCSSTTKDSAFGSVNLLRRGETTAKEFEINSAAYELLKMTVEKSQEKGEKVQKKIDEENYEFWGRYDKEPTSTGSVNHDTEDAISTDEIINLVTLARQSLKRAMGAKLKSCKIMFFSMADTAETCDSTGGAIDTVVPRTGFTIEAKTSKGSRVYSAIRGTGGLSVLKRFDKEKSFEEIVEDLAKETAKQCIDYDRAQSASVLEGEAHIVMSPTVVGVLAHEAIGHCSEADLVVQNRRDKSVDLNLKSRFGGQFSENPKFNIIDDGSFTVKLGTLELSNCYGSLIVDDEGTPAKRTQLIKNGIQQLGMNSAETFAEVAHGLPDEIATKIKEHGLSGNLRSQRFDKRPLVRMTNTFVLPDEDGPNSIEELAKEVPPRKMGLYASACTGGWVDPDTGEFQITVQLGYLIENGTIMDKPIKDIIIRGNITKFGSKIKTIGSSKTITESFSGLCGKESWVPVEGGGPAMLVENVAIGNKEPDWPWQESYREYARQLEEVACKKRKRSEVYLPFIEEAIETSKHANICMVTCALPIEDEYNLLVGKESSHADYALGEGGTLIEELGYDSR